MKEHKVVDDAYLPDPSNGKEEWKEALLFHVP